MKITRRQLRRLIKEEIQRFSQAEGFQDNVTYMVYDMAHDYAEVGTYCSGACFGEQPGFTVNEVGETLGHRSGASPSEIQGTPEHSAHIQKIRDEAEKSGEHPRYPMPRLTLLFTDPGMRS